MLACDQSGLCAANVLQQCIRCTGCMVVVTCIVHGGCWVTALAARPANKLSTVVDTLNYQLSGQKRARRNFVFGYRNHHTGAGCPGR
eukprot:1161060-Pelagomonas_calceolata.AAC.9